MSAYTVPLGYMCLIMHGVARGRGEIQGHLLRECGVQASLITELEEEII